MAPQRFSQLFRRLKDSRETFLQLCRNDVPGLLAARTYSQHLKGHLHKALADERTAKNGWCLVAVGGFGRGELSFASDLDLLFLHESRLPQPVEELIREFTYGLWDSGFEVGHVTASVSAVKRLAQEDFTVFTNYLEAAFVAGDAQLFEKWHSGFLNGFGRQGRRRFLQALLPYREGRLRQYGESSYLLEPHVKEGVGGLRDLHALRWAAIVFLQSAAFEPLIEQNLLTAQERLWLEQAYDFLWRVRLQLHQLTNRRQDQLLFPEQEQIATKLGFMDGQQGASAVEAFMRLYYRHTARIRRTTTFFLERLEESQRRLPALRIRRRILPGPFLLEGKHLHFMEPEWIRKDPRLLMRFFWQAAKSGAHFHHQAGHVIRENLGVVSEATRRDPEVLRQFFEILLNPQQAFRVLTVMLETGFLDAFLPEFAPVRYRVQHDVYHLYTVDEHMLRAVREMHAMEQGLREDLQGLGLEETFAELSNRRVLYLATLLHDVGKGLGKGHAERGALMAGEMWARLGLDAAETDLLRFLIQHHLILAETALKRDLMDEKPIMRCAIEIADRERLRLLYLVTIADSRATGPGAWNTWKASLLRELVRKVDGFLQRGDWTGEDLQVRSEEVQRQVLALFSDEKARQKVAAWLETVSFRYLLSQPPEAIVEHYALETALDREVAVIHTRPLEGEMWQISLATRDRPGLFALITGVLWARGLNILSADIYTRQSGVAMDLLRVERIPDPLHPEELWERVQSDMVNALKDRHYLDELLASRRKPSLLAPRSLPRKEDRVLIDEEASDFYTIIEVYTWDRPGVLHAITSTFFRMDITIQLAKISTPGAQVADVFYVTDLSGEKLADPAVHERVRGALLECLATA